MHRYDDHYHYGTVHYYDDVAGHHHYDGTNYHHHCTDDHDNGGNDIDIRANDFDVDNYPTIDVSGHHYILVERADFPFVIVNDDAVVLAAVRDARTRRDAYDHDRDIADAYAAYKRAVHRTASDGAD
jgi:hypothetical protein